MNCCVKPFLYCTTAPKVVETLMKLPIEMFPMGTDVSEACSAKSFGLASFIIKLGALLLLLYIAGRSSSSVNADSVDCVDM